MKGESLGSVFVAGASGAIGRPLCRLLLDEGYTVVGTTRSPQKAAMLAGMGVQPVVVDVFDAAALRHALVQSHAKWVVHQLTDLPPGLDPALLAQARVRNARLREVGTRHLIEAAIAAGVQRVVAQSIAFAYAPGRMPFDESAALNVCAVDALAAMSARSVASLEQQVLGGAFQGVVLRYGRLYGPGTGMSAAAAGGPLHVHAAAEAARRALVAGDPGIYNVAEEDGTVSSAKARRLLGWDPAFRLR
jgi:nucleoside-diphosphate-sugar epimerase